MSDLVDRLGIDADRVVIVSAEVLGRSHSANVGVYEALRSGPATSADVAVPCPWARHAVMSCDGEDVGVQLTVNADNDIMRWGPLTAAPSLLDGDGGFPRTVADLWDHADLEELRRECRAQVERAMLWGLDPTHLSTHLFALQQRPEFFDVLVDVAVHHRLPVRLQAADAEAAAGFPFRSLAAEAGIVAPDHVVPIRNADRDTINRTVDALQPGVTDLVFHPAVDTAELRALDPKADECISHHQLLREPSPVLDLLADAGIERTSYRALTDLMRN